MGTQTGGGKREILQGDLIYRWSEEKKTWVGWNGLDWHLRSK